MIEFAWPAAFALLPLPLLVRWLTKPAAISSSGALRVPFYHRLASSAGTGSRRSVHYWLRLLLASLIWIALVTALARPVYVGDEVPLPVAGRDVMMAIDLSGSMEQQDFAVDGRATTRLNVVKDVAQDFIARREGDRVGLVLFSQRAYLQAPLTFDRQVVGELLGQASVGLTGQDTAIGDAIAVAAKRLKDRPEDGRVLILLTDGASNAGVLEPLRAAELARDLGIRVYTIGVGTDQQVVQTPLGRRLVNRPGSLDEATLQQIAELTGGQYFRARNVEGLAQVYAELDRLEPIEADPQTVRPSAALYYLPLGAALLLTFCLAAVVAAPRLTRASAPSEPVGA